MVHDAPSQRRTQARGALVWEALVPHLDSDQRDVLDIGGGSGALAVRVAEAGHAVTLIDPSPDAVAAAERRAAERGVESKVSASVGDLDALADVVSGRFDMVLCHDVLGVTPDPLVALGQLRSVMAPQGVLSLIVGQVPAAVMSRAIAGHVDQALALFRGEVDGPRRFHYAEIVELLTSAGFDVETVQGVRVFSDLVPSAVVDSGAAAYADLVELERAVSRRPEFAAWAAQLHVVARRS